MRSGPPPSHQALSAIESVLLVAAEPVSVATLSRVTGLVRSEVRACLEFLAADLRRGIRLQTDGSSAQLVTAPENVEIIQRFVGVERAPALSRPALEVLSVVSYCQPVTRAEIEEARGVNSDRVLQRLVARGLIEETGRRSTPGRPVEYGTTFGFLEQFGLGSLEELPPLRENVEESPETIGLRGIGPTNQSV